MYRKFLAAPLAVFFACALLYGCGEANRPKEELLKEGIRLTEEKNSRGAVVLFKNALEQDPNYFEARYQLAKAYYNIANFDSAEKELQKVIRQNPSLKEARVELARVHVQKSRPDEALKEVGELSGEGSTDAEALSVAGWAHASKGEYREAVGYFTRSIELDPRDETKLMLARAYKLMKEVKKARSVIEEILEKDGKNRGALLFLAEIHESENDKDSALGAYEEVLKAHPGDIQASFRKGSLLVDSGKFDEALSIGKDLAEKYPNNPEGFKIKGLALLRKGGFDDSITAFQKALAMSPEPGSYYFMGLSHYSKGELEQAMSQFQKSLDLAPEFAQPRLMVSLVLLRNNRLDDAINEAKKAIEADPSNALGHNILGSAYMAKGMQEEGLSELNKAIELDPDFVDAYVKKGVYSMSKGRQKDAEASLKAAIAAGPEVLNTRLILASYYVRDREFAKAKDVIAQGLKGKKQDAPLHSLLAEIQLQEGKVDEALSTLEKAKQADPGYPAPYYTLSTVYFLTGKQDKGIAELKALAGKFPNDVRALVMLASVLEAKGAASEAAEYYSRAAGVGTKEAYMALAAHYMGKKEFARAAGYIDKALEKEKNNPALHEMKGKALASEGKYAEALKEFEEFEKLKPGAGLSHIINTYVAMKKPEQALELIKGEAVKNPGNMVFLAEIARINSIMGRFAAAEEAGMEIISKRPDLPLGHTVLAMTYQAGRQEDKAVASLKKAISMETRDVTAHMMLAALHSARKEYSSALDIYRKAEKINPKNPQVIFQQGAVYEMMGKRKEAASEYQRTLRVAGNFVPALNNLAYIYAEEGRDLKLALQIAARAYIASPKDGVVQDTVGYVLVKNGKFEEGLKLLTSSAAALPGNPTVLYHLALAHKGKGDRTKAIETLEKALGMGEFPEAAKARSLLQEMKRG